MKDNQKGTLNYKGVNYPLTVDSNALLTTNKVKGKRYKINPNPDLESYRLSFNLPLNVNTAEIISDVLTTEDAGAAAFNLFLDTSGSKKLSFNGIITGTSFSSTVGDISTVSVSFVTNGAITSAI